MCLILPAYHPPGYHGSMLYGPAQNHHTMIDAKLFREDLLARLKAYKTLGDKTFVQLGEEDFHFRPSPDSNSIAIIIQHLYGNMMSRFTNFLSEDGEKPWRRRDAEFEQMQVSRQDLVDFWETGWSHVLATVNSLSPEHMMQEITIRHEKHRVYDALLRQLAHYSYHTGQIVTIGKMIRDKAWQSLSIPKGQTEAFNAEMKSKHV